MKNPQAPGSQRPWGRMIAALGALLGTIFTVVVGPLIVEYIKQHSFDAPTSQTPKVGETGQEKAAVVQPGDRPTPPGPTSDYQQLATGRWQRVFTDAKELDGATNAALTEGVLKLDDGWAVVPSVRATDVIVR